MATSFSRSTSAAPRSFYADKHAQLPRGRFFRLEPGVCTWGSATCHPHFFPLHFLHRIENTKEKKVRAWALDNSRLIYMLIFAFSSMLQKKMQKTKISTSPVKNSGDFFFNKIPKLLPVRTRIPDLPTEPDFLSYIRNL
jgi:hypothetical protein